jgi:hypothetical protein
LVCTCDSIGIWYAFGPGFIERRALVIVPFAPLGLPDGEESFYI